MSLSPGEIDLAGPSTRPRRATPGPHSGRAAAWLSEPPPWLPWAGLALLLAVTAAALGYATRGTTFWADDWAWIIHRRSWTVGTFLEPHNSHLSLLPILIFKVLLELFGLRHYWPERAVLIAVQLLCVTLLYLYVRRRLGSYLALLAAAVIALFGPGWQDLLWPFQTAWLLAVAAGLATLLLLDRGGRRADLAACLTLTAGLASAGPALGFALAALVDVLMRRPRRQLWIVLIPIGLYALWTLGYQSAHIGLNSFLRLPQFVYDAAAGAVSSLLGLASINVLIDTGSYLEWGPPLLLLALAAAGWRMWRLGRMPPRALIVAAGLLGFWLATGIGRDYVAIGPLVLTATGDESRYLYVSAVLIVLLVSEVMVGYRPSLLAGGVITVIALAALLSNITPLRDGSALLRVQAQVTKADLGTLNMVRGIVSPSYASQGFVLNVLTAGEWYAAEGQLGAAVDSPGQLVTASGPARGAADAQLVKAERVVLTPSASAAGPPPTGATAPRVDGASSGSAVASGACQRFTPAAASAPGVSPALTVTAPPAGIVIRAGAAGASVAARRYADQTVAIGSVSAQGTAAITLRHDPGIQPWHFTVSGNGPFSVCAP